VLEKPRLLGPEACGSLRQLLRSRVSGATVDTVDGLPEYQVNLTRQELERAIGQKAVAALWALPRELDPGGAPARFTQVRCFARMYSATTRRQLAVHTDASDWTVNVALTSDDDVAGGRLVLFHSGGMHVSQRYEGDAVIHHWSVAHGVTDVSSGTRASLVLFFFNRRSPDA
jgi:predicted 2-oxoglutarate/Fe(II)-dependent dioxygenase YbiX